MRAATLPPKQKKNPWPMRFSSGQHGFLDHDEWRLFAPGLESLDDADVIRGKILRASERAEEMASIEDSGSEEIRRQLTFVLVGAETVGVEMASALAEMPRSALAHDFRHIHPTFARILLYEAAPHILPTYPEVLPVKAQRHLESLGIEVRTNARVTSLDSEGIVAGEQRILVDAVALEAGLSTSPMGRWLDAETDKSGKIIVRPGLSVPRHPEIVAIGDAAHVVAPARNLCGIQLGALQRRTSPLLRRRRSHGDRCLCGEQQKGESLLQVEPDSGIGMVEVADRGVLANV